MTQKGRKKAQPARSKTEEKNKQEALSGEATEEHENGPQPGDDEKETKTERNGGKPTPLKSTEPAGEEAAAAKEDTTTDEAKAEAEAPKEPKSGRKRKDWAAVSPPLVERPQRERRVAERFTVEDKRSSARTSETEVKPGKGTPLKDIPKVLAAIKAEKKSSETLAVLHQSIFGGARSTKVVFPPLQINVVGHLLEFSGFVHEDQKTKAKTRERFERLTGAGLHDICSILDLPQGGKKEEKLERVWSFLESPVAPPTSPQVGSTRKRKAEEPPKSAAKGRKGKKAAEEGEEEEKGGEEDEGEEDEDYGSPSAKKPKRASGSSKKATPKKSGSAKAKGKGKRTGEVGEEEEGEAGGKAAGDADEAQQHEDVEMGEAEQPAGAEGGEGEEEAKEKDVEGGRAKEAASGVGEGEELASEAAPKKDAESDVKAEGEGKGEGESKVEGVSKAEDESKLERESKGGEAQGEAAVEEVAKGEEVAAGEEEKTLAPAEEGTKEECGGEGGEKIDESEKPTGGSEGQAAEKPTEDTKTDVVEPGAGAVAETAAEVGAETVADDAVKGDPNSETEGGGTA